MKTKYIALAVVVMLATLSITSCIKDDVNVDDTKWVDLDLPSGLLWAANNVGATAPEDYGDLFAWGETNTKNTYDWSTYLHSNKRGDLSKYCSRPLYGRNHFTDTLTILQPDDDAATTRICNGGRTPKIEEWQELLDNTSATWTTRNGTTGYLFTAPNGNSLFLPAAGLCSDKTIDSEGIGGNYWSSSLETDYPTDAWCFDFDSVHQEINKASRYKGFSIRAVRDAR